jgi:hypothetical protein
MLCFLSNVFVGKREEREGRRKILKFKRSGRLYSVNPFVIQKF